MFYNFKDYLNDSKKIVEHNLNYNYDDYFTFNKILDDSYKFIINDYDFDLFIENELNELLDKKILWGSSFIEITKQKLKECIIKGALTNDFDSTIKRIKLWLSGYNQYYIIPLYGTCAVNKIYISDNISLINLNDLPCCRLKMEMVKKRSDGQSWVECFLKIKIGNYQLVNKLDKAGLICESNKFYTDFEIVNNTLKYIFPFLPVIIGSGCIPYHETIFLIDNFYYDNHSIIDSPDFLRRLQNINHKYICMVDETNINIDIVNKYLALPDNIKCNLIPALEYYNKYLLCYESQYADAAIFLRIALETLLLEGYDGAKKFQVSHRAAYLLNYNNEIINNCSNNGFKIDVYRFSALYSITSTFIHGDESYDSSSMGFGYTSVSQGYISNLVPSIRKIFVNYINTLIINLHKVEGKEYYNDIIFRSIIRKIKDNSACDKSEENKCIFSDYYIQKFINELLAYEGSNEYLKDRYMLFKLLNDKLNGKIYKYKTKPSIDPNPFNDITVKPLKFDDLMESSKRFITATLADYYDKIECADVPRWIIDYTASTDDDWITLNDEIVPPSFDISKVARHYATRKLLPTAVMVSV